MFKVFVIFVCLGAFSVDAKSVVSTEFDLLEAKALNDNPIIGVLSQEISFYLNGKYPDQFNSYIAASYVKFVEGGGSRVVPVWIGKSKEYYQDIMSKLNGILLPGGGTYFNQSGGYADAGKHIYDIAIEMNNQGDYFPIWGTCLGFELLTYLSANGNEHRAHCSSMNQPLPLEFQPDYQTSRMFRDAPAKVVKILTTEAVTSNFHQYCVTQKNLTDFNLDSEWRVMSVNKDWNGMEFISTIEHVNYPFYGVQFHPEKNLYEWVLNKNISHSSNAILASQYFAQFFINEARKSDHHFDNAKNEDNHVIYNFPATFTGAKGSAFEQSYMFND
ncbi:unnamed protein product, partial [Diamesa hyperborea]